MFLFSLFKILLEITPWTSAHIFLSAGKKEKEVAKIANTLSMTHIFAQKLSFHKSWCRARLVRFPSKYKTSFKTHLTLKNL